MILITINNFMTWLAIMLIGCVLLSESAWLATRSEKVLKLRNRFIRTIPLMVFIWVMITIANIVAIVASYL